MSKQLPGNATAPKIEEALCSHWDGNKFVKINNAQLFKLCKDEGQDLLVAKDVFERESKALEKEAGKQGFKMQKSKNYVHFLAKPRKSIIREGNEFILK